jgi:hypothetical protein
MSAIVEEAKTMKKVFVPLIVVCSAIAVFAIGTGVKNKSKPKSQAWGVIIEGFQLSATPEKGVVTSGEPVRLTVRIRNTTKQDLYLATTGTDYRVSVQRDTGKTVPLMKYGKLLENMEENGIYNIGLTIKPGQEREDVLLVSSIYDMSDPGNYSITVERKVGKITGGGVSEIKSNTVNVQVVR